MSWYRSLSLALLAASCHSPSAPPALAMSPAATTDGVFDVGGASLHIHCVGDGGPIVVFDAGHGSDGTAWEQVTPGLSRLTRACVYDRAGRGYSSAAPRPRTSQHMVRELHTLLERAGIPGPYVLVGHSLGGLNVRLYASQYPSEVVGMVLVDASTEEQDSRYWGLLPPAQLHKLQDILHESPEGMTYDAFRESMAQLRAAPRVLGGMPLVVLTHGKEEPEELGVSPEVSAQMARAWGEMQAELPRLSSNSAHVVAVNSRHFIQFDAPKLVVAAVREVVLSQREHRHVNADVLAPLASEAPAPEAR